VTAVLGAVGLVFVVLVTACGGDPKPAEAPPKTSVSRPSAAAESASAKPSRSPSEGECAEGMTSIPGGTLRMGSPEGRGRADERPQHKVEIRAFCFDTREVTIADYQACVKNAICDAPPREVQLLEPTKQDEHEARSKLCTAQLADNSDLPVNCVGHDEASKYCAWKGRRLPTEAEWEWAATSGDDKLDYAWGATPPRDDALCWQQKRPCTVGSKPAEAFGLFDLGGNVSEWTESPYGAYPTPPESATKLSVRGGNFLDAEADAVRPRRRGSEEPLFRDITLGFRCAKDL
jgi:serine/threonine-protein kinase